MARDMDPERRRRLTELGRWHDEWQAQHGIDDAEWSPFGADPDNRRAPTPEQEREFMRRADEIMGYDPDTGRYLGDLERPPTARTDHEAQVYMDRSPCYCDAARSPRPSTVVELPDGGRANRFAGVCPRCGSRWEFVFRLPEPPLPTTGGFRYGGPEPSELLDPGEWLLVADGHAAAVPGDPHRLPEAGQRRARQLLIAAAAAIDEALKFVPPGHASVPATANWSEPGDSLFLADPDRFQTAALVAARDSYRERADRLA